MELDGIYTLRIWGGYASKLTRVETEVRQTQQRMKLTRWMGDVRQN